MLKGEEKGEHPKNRGASWKEDALLGCATLDIFFMVLQLYHFCAG
jgi:hypothetical protein